MSDYQDKAFVRKVLDWTEFNPGIYVEINGLAVTYLHENPIKNKEDAGPLTEGWFVKTAGFDTGSMLLVDDATEEILRWIDDSKKEKKTGA